MQVRFLLLLPPLLLLVSCTFTHVTNNVAFTTLSREERIKECFPNFDVRRARGDFLMPPQEDARRSHSAHFSLGLQLWSGGVWKPPPPAGLGLLGWRRGLLGLLVRSPEQQARSELPPLACSFHAK